ncbi:MAG: helix-turn-helix transcriptional regulator [Halobacteriovoraceae bacterium]|nr:helix-turn-helix transcriptional regulator [Halobacteriovoraceae bacterium]
MTRPYIPRKKKKPGGKKPKTRLRVNELLEGYSKEELAYIMGITYTQIYPLLKKDANPTLSTLESLAKGLSKLRGEKIELVDILGL